MNKPVALITGVSGQDGSYLAELLLQKGYEVHGVKRRASSLNTSRIDHLYEEPQKEGARFFLHYGDMTDATSLDRLIEKIAPNEVYNLAAQSHVGLSFELPDYTTNVTGHGVLRILNSIQRLGAIDSMRFYQASTSELFGNASQSPQSETTPFHPLSPYGVAKLFGYWTTINYREAFGLHASNGILFNHESPRRGETFVTRKICRAIAAQARGAQEILLLGNLDARRDWGHAADYVEGMWRILQQTEPGDYVLATGESHSVREFAEAAYKAVDIEIEWRGKGLCEVGVDSHTGDTLIKVDPRYFRPAEIYDLVGDASKATSVLGWTPKVGFTALVEGMVQAELDVAIQG